MTKLSCSASSANSNHGVLLFSSRLGAGRSTPPTPQTKGLPARGDAAALAGLQHPHALDNHSAQDLWQIVDFIWIDQDAGGLGWFVDATPLDDHEFVSNRADD